jgi:hypothetical protein
MRLADASHHAEQIARQKGHGGIFGAALTRSAGPFRGQAEKQQAAIQLISGAE